MNIEDGGLGVSHVQYRARAALIITFLQTAIKPEFQRNFYHNTLYRVNILGEQIQAPQIPPNFQGNFFPTIRKLRSHLGELETVSMRSIYDFLIAKLLREEPDNDQDQSNRQLLPLKYELALPTTEWTRSWRLARLKGPGPEVSSYLLQMLWGILPTKERLHRLIPLLHVSPLCLHCGVAGHRLAEDL